MKLVLFAPLRGHPDFKRRIVSWANSLSDEHQVTLMSPRWTRPLGLTGSVHFFGFGRRWKRRFQALNYSDWVIYNFGGDPVQMRRTFQHSYAHPGLAILHTDHIAKDFRQWFKADQHFKDQLSLIEELEELSTDSAIWAHLKSRARASIVSDTAKIDAPASTRMDLDSLSAPQDISAFLENTPGCRINTFVRRFAKRMTYRAHTDFKQPILENSLLTRMAEEVGEWYPNKNYTDL